MTLLDMVRDYQSLLERKEELADEVKANNALIEEAKANISQQMIDDDCPSISVGGFKFTLTPKTIYSKKSEAELASEGINFFETLREEGLGDIIVESVNTRHRHGHHQGIRRGKRRPERGPRQVHQHLRHLRHHPPP